MPDIDSLSIQLTSKSSSAVKGIDDVINALSRLNGALNNYSDGSQYIKGINTLVGGFTNLSKSIDSLNYDKLKKLSNTLGTLAKNGQNLANMTFVQTFSQMGSEVQTVNSKISEAVKTLSKDFSIPEEGAKRLTYAVRRLYSSCGDTDEIKAAKAEIINLAHEYNDLETVRTEEQRKFREFQKTNKIYIPKEVMHNWGKDDWKKNRGVLGIKGSTTMLGNGTSLEVWAKEFNQTYGAILDVDHGLQACADSMIELLSKGNESEIGSITHKMYELDEALKILSEDYARYSAQQSKPLVENGEMLEPKFDKDIPADAERAVTAINSVDNAINNVQAEARQEIANPFEGIVKGLESLQGITIPKDSFAGISSLSTSFARFAKGDVNKSVENIQRITQSFVTMATQLSSLPAVSENVIRLAEALSRFSRQAGAASTESSKLNIGTTILSGAFNGLFTSSHKARKGFTSLAAVFGKLYANFFLLIRGARLLGKAIDYSSSMTEAQNVVSVAFGTQAGALDDFAQSAIKDYGMARLSAAQFASRFQSMGKTMGITAEQIGNANSFITEKIEGNTMAYDDLGDSVADMSINLTKLTADMASLYNQDYEDVAEDMAAIYTGMTRPLRKYGLDLTEATLKEWAMSQGLNSNIDSMTQAEKTMLRYQYVMTRAAGAMGDFQKTADTWANAMRTVKQLLQEFARVIGEALINALKPALLAFRQFMFNMLSAAEKGLNALGKLLGWQQIDFGSASLAEDTEDYAEALDDAAGAAKKLKGQLRGIDELNNLTSNNGSGGGAGGSGITGADAADIWENIPENPKIYESTVESFYDFGQRVSEAIKQGLDNIDWNAVYERVGNFGTNFASFLNGLFQPDTFASLGKTIAGGLNTAFRLAFSFGSEFNFRNAGVSLAELINNLFADFDFAQAAQTINTWAKGLFDFINGLLKGDENGEGGLDTEMINDKLKEFFGNLDIAGWSALALPLLAKLAGKLVKGAIKALALLAGKQIKTVLIPAVTKELGTFFSIIFANPVGFIRTTGGFLIRVFRGAFEAVFAALGGYTIGNGLGEVFALLMGDYDLAQEYENMSLLSLLGIDMDLWEESWQETFDDLGLDKLFSGDILGYIKNGADYNYGWLWELIKGPEAVDFLVEKWNGIKDFLDPFAKVIAEKITGVDETLGEWWDNTMVPMFDFPKWEGLFTTIPDALKQVWEEAVLFWTTEVPEWWENDVKPNFTVKKLLEAFGNIGKALKDAWSEGKKETFEKLTEIKDDVIKFFAEGDWKEYISGAVKALTDMWSDPLSVAKGFFNSLADFAEGFINGAIDGFGKLHNLKNLFSDKNESFNIDHIKIPRFAEGGFPTVGSLFVAGEAGSELVGNINGRTGVVSNGEISGIASAIRSTSDTEVQLLRQQNVLLQGILEKEFGITDGQIFNSVRKSSREYTRSTGLYAF